MIDPAVTVEVGLGGVHRQTRQEVCIAASNPFMVLKDGLVSIGNLDPPSNSEVMFGNLVEVFQDPMVREITEGSQNHIT